jgi:hypothetical protein
MNELYLSCESGVCDTFKQRGSQNMNPLGSILGGPLFWEWPYLYYATPKFFFNVEPNQKCISPFVKPKYMISQTRKLQCMMKG